MARIELPDERIAVEGAIGIDRTPTGIVARRMGAAYRHQLPPEVEFLASAPSGVRLRLTTDSSSIGVELLATRVQVGDEAPYPTIVDIVVDDALVSSGSTDEGHTLVLDPINPANISFVPGEPASLTFSLPAGEKTVELWLPNTATIEARTVTLDDGASLHAPPANGRRRWVHHGSSISHCMEAHGPSRVWPAVAARRGDVHLTNLGLAGQCHLDGFTARTMRDHPADLLSLKVGINVVNADSLRFRTFPSALHAFLDTVREGHPTTPFLVVTPILCPAHENAPGPTISGPPDGQIRAGGTEKTLLEGALTLERIRGLITDVVAARQRNGDHDLHLLDGRELFGADDLADLPDGLHPNGDGYERMGERFAALAFASGGPLSR